MKSRKRCDIERRTGKRAHFLLDCHFGQKRLLNALNAGAELWAGLSGPVPALIDSWPAQSEKNKIIICIVKHGYYDCMWCI